MRSMTIVVALFISSTLAAAQTAAPKTTGVTKPTPAPEQPKPAAPTGPAPKVELSITEWDLGSLWWGDPAESQLQIKNVGELPLEIKHVKTSCGCTVAQPSKKVLASGESDTVKLSYNTKKGALKVSQNITVETNDPVRPTIMIPVRGEVRPLFNCTPTSAINFNQVATESKVSQSIEMENAFDKPLNLKLKPLPANSPFDVTLDEVEAGKKYRLTATTRPPLAIGYRNQPVILETGEASHPTVEVAVTANALAPVSISPAAIFVYSNQQKSATPPAPRPVRLMFLKDRKVEIKEFKSSFEKVRAQVITSPAPRNDPIFETVTFQVYVPYFDELPETGATLEVFTTDPDYPSFTIPIRRQVFNAPGTATGKPAVTGGQVPKPNAPVPPQPQPESPTPVDEPGKPTPPPSKGG